MKSALNTKAFKYAIGFLALILVISVAWRQAENRLEKIEERKNKKDLEEFGKSSVDKTQLTDNSNDGEKYKKIASRFVNAFKGGTADIFGESARTTAMGEVLLLNDEEIKEVGNKVIALSSYTMRKWVEGEFMFFTDMDDNFLKRLSEIGI